MPYANKTDTTDQQDMRTKYPARDTLKQEAANLLMCHEAADLKQEETWH